ncbi:MAG TPA: cell filamentation protein Fic [Cellulomonas sp.]|uniref:cell filamentation protein Fic n=1 Tax=Cellulomonas sp. TaxID=40001 RepID=UPI002E35C630|nr:cell filamentation protein Fic [Cellulomonas sp.]HEX5331698.1 cell filamentation protein Fic [Cellulomonas sp.]
MLEPPAPRSVDAGDPLAGVVALPGVGDAVDAARRACEELRWHEAYRRRWREVRAEAGIRSARASAALDGARVPVDVVRGLALGSGASEQTGAGLVGAGRGGPDVDVALGALRAAVEVERLMPDLGARGAPVLPPLGQLVARVHAAAGRGWLPDDTLGRLRTDAAPQDLYGLGPAPDAADLAGRIDLLARVLGGTRAPAPVVAAVVHGELLTLRPFAAGNGVVARAVARLVLTARGLDPTGSLLPEVAWAEAPNAYLGAAAGFATGTPEGVGAWVRACADGVVAGADAARAVADAVVAGRLTR